MGALADKAAAQSNFLILEKGGVVKVKYLGYRFVPSRLDPAKEVVQYKVEGELGVKYWENGSARVMRVMDKIKDGAFIKISRGKWMNKDGTETAQKSSYEVVEIDKYGQPVNPVSQELEQGNVGATEKGWDD